MDQDEILMDGEERMEKAVNVLANALKRDPLSHSRPPSRSFTSAGHLYVAGNRS